MSEQTFPAWYGPADSDPIEVRSALEIQDGWVEHFGHYDHPRGCWVPNDPLDHDGDGEKGGSITAPGDMKALRAEYQAKFGKRAFNGWDEATLRAKLGDAQ